MNDKGQVRGQAYAYGTTPTELAQRLSTTASTAASLEMALALSGKIQAAGGASLQSGADYMRSAAQTAAALERIPLVVGFSDRRGTVAEPGPARAKAGPVSARVWGRSRAADAPGPLASPPTRAPQFGWVFGPKLRFDTHRQRFVFEQSVASFDVAADISVPSWWPRVELEVVTAWIANWHDATDVLKKEKRSARPISVPLPVNRADLDGLTKFLTKDSIRRSAELTTIHFVEPNVISACADKVTFLVYGANIWRSAEVYLGGSRGEQVKVLPDMEGISATFNLAEFYKTQNKRSNPLGYEEIILRVNTRNGKDWRPIRIVGSREPGTAPDSKSPACSAPYSVPSPIVRHQQTSVPTIFAIAPSALELCSDEARIVVTGRNLMLIPKTAESANKPEEPLVFLNGLAGKVEPVNATLEPSSLQVISLTFAKPGGPSAVRDNHELIILNKAGFSVATLGAVTCRGATAEPASMRQPRQDLSEGSARQ